MRPNKFAATAVLAIGALGLSAGIVQAQAIPVHTGIQGSGHQNVIMPGADIQVTGIQGTGHQGVDHDIPYTVTPAADGSGVVSTLATGHFVLAPDARSVALTDAAGNTVVTVPLGLRTTTGTVGLTPRIENSGRTLTLTPQSTVRPIDDYSDTIARKQYNAAVGALIGAGIGAVLGFFLGGVGALVTIPIGAGIGALIGYSTP